MLAAGLLTACGDDEESDCAAGAATGTTVLAAAAPGKGGRGGGGSHRGRSGVSSGHHDGDCDEYSPSPTVSLGRIDVAGVTAAPRHGA
ncbi:hypothetical protein AQ490_10560 [Wenjunlia vitaminophila]|uniref:Uncharacterized protein n=1 Tax=Wenjunlia vitaminophila TaxID=76728 RepID=A0A0T6LJT5_WENVI|nr:hypothetical protein AQ490_10560 [Wenjunlia vitaminophila]